MKHTTKNIANYLYKVKEFSIEDAAYWVFIVVMLLAFVFGGYACVVMKNAYAQEIQLKASWYSEASLNKEGTFKTSKGIMANGQRFNENALTCATRLYPFNTKLKITNKNNGKSVIVEVTDRISKRFANKRIDLSKTAFKQIAELRLGIVPIKVEENND